jgi:hypothetical protein
MSRLDELIAEFCPDGVEFVELNEVLDYEQLKCPPLSRHKFDIYPNTSFL